VLPLRVVPATGDTDRRCDHSSNLLFGGTKIPQLARGLGEGIHELKRSMEGAERGNAISTSANAVADATALAVRPDPAAKGGSSETTPTAT
jgi:Sec-independent protein translocase protein TatA